MASLISSIDSLTLRCVQPYPHGTSKDHIVQSAATHEFNTERRDRQRLAPSSVLLAQAVSPTRGGTLRAWESHVLPGSLHAARGCGDATLHAEILASADTRPAGESVKLGACIPRCTLFAVVWTVPENLELHSALHVAIAGF
jgi:hypothetical protein